MIVTNPDASVTQLALQLARLPPASSPAPAATTPLPTAPATTVPQAAAPPMALPAGDAMTALLSGPSDPPDMPLPSGDLARRYAQSGTLTPRLEQAVPTAVALSAADDGLLSALTEAYRNGTPASAGAPQGTTTAQGLPHPPLSLVVDGRTIPLTPAQAVAVRAVLGAANRRIGPGAATTDSEDPTALIPQSSRDASQSGKAVAALTPTQEAHRRLSDNAQAGHGRDADHLAANKTETSTRDHAVTAVRAATIEIAPVPYQPEAIPLVHHDPTVLAPAPDVPVLAGPQMSTVSGIAIGFAAGVSAQDVSIISTPLGVAISVHGAQTMLVKLQAPLDARLLFADGTVGTVHFAA